MSLKRHSREIVLGGAMLALLLYFFRPTVPGREILSSVGGVQGPEDDTALTVLDAPEVDLALLTQQPGEYGGGGRNLFDYGRIVPPPPSREELDRMARDAEARRRQEEAERKRREAERERLRQEALKKQQELAEQRRNEPPPAPAPPKPVPPTFPYKFIGVVGEASSKIAIFLDKQDFLMAQEGETVKEDFRIVRIGYDTLQIGYTDPLFQEESRILQMGKD